MEHEAPRAHRVASASKKARSLLRARAKSSRTRTRAARMLLRNPHYATSATICLQRRLWQESFGASLSFPKEYWALPTTTSTTCRLHNVGCAHVMTAETASVRRECVCSNSMSIANNFEQFLEVGVVFAMHAAKTCNSTTTRRHVSSLEALWLAVPAIVVLLLLALLRASHLQRGQLPALTSS